jgi:hypothetical protein
MKGVPSSAPCGCSSTRTVKHASGVCGGRSRGAAIWTKVDGRAAFFETGGLELATAAARNYRMLRAPRGCAAIHVDEVTQILTASAAQTCEIRVMFTALPYGEGRGHTSTHLEVTGKPVTCRCVLALHSAGQYRRCHAR